MRQTRNVEIIIATNEFNLTSELVPVRSTLKVEDESD
jgi:hypothetical protein